MVRPPSPGAVAALTIVAALAIAIPASASLVQHRGYITHEPFTTRVQFIVLVEHHKPKLVRAFTIRNMPFSCADGHEGEIDVPELARIPVRHHRFELTDHSARSTEKVSGYVFGGGKSVTTGGVSYSFKRSDGTACTTGERRWLGNNAEVIR